MEPDTVSRRFDRSFDELAALFEMTSSFFDRHGIGPEARQVVDLALEELFTNYVKYHPENTNRIEVVLRRAADGVEVTLTDFDVEPFDLTATAEIDVGRPIEERRPGGLGIHLIKRMMDEIRYDYDEVARRSRTTMLKRVD